MGKGTEENYAIANLLSLVEISLPREKTERTQSNLWHSFYLLQVYSIPFYAFSTFAQDVTL